VKYSINCANADEASDGSKLEFWVYLNQHRTLLLRDLCTWYSV